MVNVILELLIRLCFSGVNYLCPNYLLIMSELQVKTTGLTDTPLCSVRTYWSLPFDNQSIHSPTILSFGICSSTLKVPTVSRIYF